MVKSGSQIKKDMLYYKTVVLFLEFILKTKLQMKLIEVYDFRKSGGKTMTITDVWVRKIAKEGKLKAIVSITLDNEFVVHDIKVIEGEKGLFIAMPSKKSADGEYRDVAHPINSATRESIQSTILEAYQKSLLEEV